MMISALNRLAQTDASGPTIHIAPSELFTIGGFPITNSMIFNVVVALIMIIGLGLIARRMTLRPKGGLTQLIEIGSEFVINMLAGSLGDRQKAIKYAPYFTTIFFFIMISSIFGLLPGIGEAFTYNEQPVFRAFTADLNGTLAAAVISMVMIQYFAIRESGFIKHVRHYFAGRLFNPLTYLVGFYEVFNELIRVFSLALRLFLNIAIGEIIIAVFSYLGKFAAPLTALPFLVLELGVGILQSYIFVMLSVTYLSLAIRHGHAEEDEALEHTAEAVKAGAV